MVQFKPLLAATLEQYEFDKVIYPVLASPKLDGIRVIILNGIPVTRSLKPVRNKQVQSILANPDFEGLDGEILVGDPSNPMAFRNTTSGVMAEEGESDFVFHVFDDVRDPLLPFRDRLIVAEARIDAINHPRIKLVKHEIVLSPSELSHFEELFVLRGFEGVMVRSVDGPYKYGRSTLKEGTLLKVKRFVDAEATIIGFQELHRNCNEQTRDNLGHAERSSHKENMMPAGTLGALEVMCDTFKEPFTIGSGLDDATRQKIWDNKADYIDRIVKFKYMAYGGYDQPRIPIYLGIRDADDQ
jgi:DNA ligase-1